MLQNIVVLDNYLISAMEWWLRTCPNHDINAGALENNKSVISCVWADGKSYYAIQGGNGYYVRNFGDGLLG